MNLSIRDMTTRLRTAGTEGRHRLLSLQADVLDRTGDLLERSPEVVGIRQLAGAAQKLVSYRLDRLTHVDVDGWDAANARTAIKQVKEIEDRGTLLALRRREAVTKNRKTVLGAIDERLERLEPRARAA